MTLALQSVSKTYAAGRKPPVRAVQALDLVVNDGEIVALLGSSGCGKTSTLRMIAGFEAVSEGGITLAGKRIETLAPSRRGVAMAFEGYALYPPLTIAENIGFGLDHDGVRRDRAAIAAQVREIAELLEIAPILARYPVNVSGGQQQRTSLARALARDADLHLLDEPMGQLEPQLRSVLRGRVKAWLKARGMTALLVTHDQTEANAMADRIAVMEGGVLQQYGEASVLRERPANLFVATFLGEPPTNALPATTEAGGVQVSGLPLVNLPASVLPRPGTAVVLGVRPHHVRIGGGEWRASVVSNQWLGDQAHVVLDAGGHLVVAVAHQRVPARLGSEVSFDIAPDDTHVFDATTGAALLHGGRPA